ncbi:MAG: endonuclease III [Planctomycetota bacterium]
MPSVESFKKRRERVAAMLPVLKSEHPDARCSLDFDTPLQLLVATILSAQCTDARVNLTTPALFDRYRNARAIAESDPAELESMVKSCGFFRQKAKSIRSMAADLVEHHDGKVPKTMEEMTKLAGVGRKTANVVLGDAIGVFYGIAVDTHVGRLSRRLALSKHDDAVKVEADLMKIVPREEWAMFSHLLIHHGRRICDSRTPKCDVCVLFDHCPSGPKVIAQREKATSRKTKPSSKRATSSTSKRRRTSSAVTK